MNDYDAIFPQDPTQFRYQVQISTQWTQPESMRIIADDADDARRQAQNIGEGFLEGIRRAKPDVPGKMFAVVTVLCIMDTFEVMEPPPSSRCTDTHVEDGQHEEIPGEGD